MVLLNRFLQPEIDTETLAVRPGADLSSLAGETPSVRKKILNPFPNGWC